MRNFHACPKCRAQTIIRIPGVIGAYSAGNPISLGVWPFSAVEVTRYLCTSCGFLEHWVNEQADLERIKAKYGPQV